MVTGQAVFPVDSSLRLVNFASLLITLPIILYHGDKNMQLTVPLAQALGHMLCCSSFVNNNIVTRSYEAFHLKLQFCVERDRGGEYIGRRKKNIINTDIISQG